MKVALFALLALAAAPTLSGQEPPPPPSVFGERVDVEVVNVDVIVTGSDGRPVTDLGRDEFELWIDGRATPIEFFTAPRGERPALAAAPANPLPVASPELFGAAALARSLLVVYVDQSAMEPHTSGRILDEIREFVVPRLDGSLQVLIAGFSTSLRMFGKPATDAAGVDAALEGLRSLAGRGSMIQTERNQLEREIRASGAPPSFAVSPRRAAEYRESERRRLETVVRAFSDAAFDRQERSLRALQQWVSGLASLEGRKSVLLATGGITSNPASYFLDLLESKRQSSDFERRSPTRIALNLVDGLAGRSAELLAEFESLVRTAQNGRVVLYTLSPRTPPEVQSSPQFGGLGGEMSESTPRDFGALEANSSVVRLAQATGGRNLFLDEGLSDRLTAVAEDEVVSYSLGFTAELGTAEGDHRIEVRVKRAELKVRHRESFRRRTVSDRAEGALLAQLSRMSEANPLGLEIVLGEPEPGKRRRDGSTVPLLVKIPLRGVSLAPQSGSFAGKLSARVGIYDASGRLRLGEAQPIDIRVAEADLPRVATHNWAYRAEMRLAPGPNEIAVVVVDEVAGVIATANSSIEVPGKRASK